jgi:tetratricopeptide (TPR) repeat protein
MLDQQITESFIGHVQELAAFDHWFANIGSDTPWILFFHDALSDKKGGVGKTWLLRKCAATVKQHDKDVAVVVIDFFSVADRDGAVIAQHVVENLQTVYPQWSPTASQKVLAEYQAATEQRDGSITTRLYEALAHDMAILDQELNDTGKHLLVFFDTFELIEMYPLIAVLGLNFSPTFPNNYGFKHMGVVIAGRNAPDWTHQNWKGREHEVQVVPIEPFSIEEMTQFLHDNCTVLSYLEAQSLQARALYERTQGRPILIGLVTDVLNRRILTLEHLIETSIPDFESYLVVQINYLEQPINWIVLFMAHIYHRFNSTLLKWLFAHSLDIKTLVEDVDFDVLAEELLELSFVRRSESGDNLALHDEMRRLVNDYIWPTQEQLTMQYRRELSLGVISYYEQELALHPNEPLQQVYTVEMLYHKLFVDTNEGLAFFQQKFRRAITLWKSAFARLLLQEAQKFHQSFSQTQQYDMLLNEASLLWREENSLAAIDCYNRLELQADKPWFDEHGGTIFYEKGNCYQQIGKFPEAITCFRKALEFTTEQNSPAFTATVFGKLGYICQRQGELENASNYFDESIRIHKAHNNLRGYAEILNSQATLYRLQGRLEEALRRCIAAWRIRKDLYEQGKGASEIGIGISLNTMGLTYLKLGDHTNAQKSFQSAYEIYERNNYKAGIAAIFMRFGQLAMEKNELPTAIKRFNEAYTTSLGVDVGVEITCLNKLGWIRVLQKEWKEAIPLFEKAIERASQISYYYQKAESLIDLAGVLEHLGQHEDAQLTMQKAEIIARKYHYYYLLGLASSSQGDSYYSVGDYLQAFKYFGICCYYMAHYNSVQYEKAVRKITNALLILPKQQFTEVLEALTNYWSSVEVKDKETLSHALEEVSLLMGVE